MSSHTYIPNRACQCPRCRVRGLMGPVVLITLGVLFLLEEVSSIDFDRTFPALLIVIGVVLYLGRSASTDGHVEAWRAGGPPPPPPPIASGQHGPEVSQ